MRQAAGLARHDKQRSKDEGLARLEGRARAARTGLWSQDRTVAPWQYRASAREPAR